MPTTTATTTARRSPTMPLSLLSFLKNDDEDLLGDLLNAPGRTLATLRRRVAELDRTTIDLASVDGLDWSDPATASDDDELASILEDNTAELDRARKAARRRLRVAELLIETHIE